MQKHYQPHLIKDSSGGASISHFLGDELIIHESDIYALDITHCPNLERIQIRALAPNRTPHLSLFELPNLQKVVISADIQPAIIHAYALQVPHELVIEGKIESMDACWDKLTFALEAYKAKEQNKAPWQGFELVRSHNFAQLNRKNFLLLATGDLSAHLKSRPSAEAGIYNPPCLTIEGGNQWLLINTSHVPEIVVNSEGFTYLKNIKHTQALHFSSTYAKAHIEGAPDLESIYGEGHSLFINLTSKKNKTLNILGAWYSSKLRGQNLQALNAPQLRALMVLDAPRIKEVDLSLETEVECHGSVPSPLSQTARFYFHESTVKNILERLYQGETDLLPSLLNILPHASHRHQVRHSLNTLWQLCEIFIDAKAIWKVRCELMDNNSARTHKVFGEEALIPQEWHWNLPDDLSVEAWLTDLKIWDYCQKTVPEARAASDYMAEKRPTKDEIRHFAKVFATKSTSLAQKTLVARLFHSHLRGENIDEYFSDILYSSEGARRIALEIKQTSNIKLRDTLITIICYMLDKEEFLKMIPPLIHTAPDVFRSILLEMSQGSVKWKECVSRNSASEKAAKAKERAQQILLMMALTPFPKPESESETPQLNKIAEYA